MILAIAADVLHRLESLCRAAWPLEACGLLLGVSGEGSVLRVTRFVPAANLAASGQDRFELDPAVRFQVERSLRAANGPERLLGHYHSHPNGVAVPSATDAAMVYEPDLLWMIVATDGQGGAESRVFAWDQAGADGVGGFRSVHLQKITSHF